MCGGEVSRITCECSSVPLACRLFFVIEFVRGGDLMFHMQRQRRLPEEHARFYSAEISLALNFLHERGEQGRCPCRGGAGMLAATARVCVPLGPGRCGKPPSGEQSIETMQLNAPISI